MKNITAYQLRFREKIRRQTLTKNCRETHQQRVAEFWNNLRWIFLIYCICGVAIIYFIKGSNSGYQKGAKDMKDSVVIYLKQELKKHQDSLRKPHIW